MYLSEGDRVRVDIPNKDDPDFDHFHGEYGVITAVLNDDAGFETENTRDSWLYQLELDLG